MYTSSGGRMFQNAFGNSGRMPRSALKRELSVYPPAEPLYTPRMKTMIRTTILVLLAMLLSQCRGGTMKDLQSAIPEDIRGWTSEGEDALYDRETLYDYMNGGAEVYLAFDLRDVFARRYSGEGTDEIVLDIYRMGSSAEAFGVFSCDREDPTARIGQASEYGYGLLRFWQGDCFVSIVASGDHEVAEEAILELGKAVAGALGPDGPGPELLGILPAEDLIPDRISYFHSNINLNNRFFIASENILNLTGDTNCVFAEFESEGQGTIKLLIVEYPDENLARAALTSFIDAYLPESSGSGLARMEDGQWTQALIEGTCVSIVFDSPDSATALNLHSSIQFDQGDTP